MRKSTFFSIGEKIGTAAFLAVLYCLGFSAVLAQASANGSIGSVTISLDSSSLSEGLYRLDFELPENVELGPEAHFIRLQQTIGFQTNSFSLLETSQWFRRESTDAQYAAQLCISERGRRDECGPVSASISVDVPPDLAVKVPKSLPVGTSNGRSVGPALFRPGVYVDPEKLPGNAWTFNWANKLRFPQLADTFPEEFYDLAIRWQTFEYDPQLGTTVAIWLWAQLEVSPSNSNVFTGLLRYRERNGTTTIDRVVGEIEVRPLVQPGNSLPEAEQVEVTWITDLSTMYPGAPMELTNTLSLWNGSVAPGTNPLPQKSYSGDWNDDPGQVPDEQISLLLYSENQHERIDVLFNDANGRPAWAVAGRGTTEGSLTMGMETFCPFTVVDAALPGNQVAGQQTPGDRTVQFLSCDPANPATASLGRSYDPVPAGIARTAQFWADFRFPAGSRPGGVNYASPASPGQIRKLTRFHDIRTVINGVDHRTSCIVETGQQCAFNLRWHLDGLYPNAAVFRKTLPGGTPQLVFDAIAPEMSLSSELLLGDGDYEFQIRRNSSTTSDLIARSHPLKVRTSNVDTALPPEPNPGFQPDIDSTATGSTRGDFRVTESGAATYGIPIMTAPSGGGMAPQISLGYNSQSGSGDAGLGWSLQGLSTITRCSKSFETDGENGGVTLKTSDRFCLDGQRLIAINGAYGEHGTEYRLEVDRHVRVKSFSPVRLGVAYFQVWRKDGTISWYGATESTGSDNGNSRVSSKTNGGQSVIWSWNIGRIEDSAGNYMRFLWEDRHVGTNAVETVIDRIEYGGNTNTGVLPNNTIDIAWQPVPADHARRGYVAGMELVSTSRINQIESKADAQQIRRYELTFDDSLQLQEAGGLVSIQECNGSYCFPPTEFDWYEADVRLGATVEVPEATTLPDTQKVVQPRVIDLNDDGLGDLIWIEERNNDDNNPPIIRYRLAIPDGDGIRYPALGIVDIDMYTGLRDADEPPQLQILDVNGDGFNDLLYASHYSAPNVLDPTFRAHFWTGAGFGPPVNVGAFTGSADKIAVLDWDGDGLADLLYQSIADNGSFLGELGSLRMMRNVAAEPGGVNGTTYFVEQTGIPVSLSSDHFPTGNVTVDNPINFTFLPNKTFDSNGDGRADVVLRLWSRVCVEFCPDPQRDPSKSDPAGSPPVFHTFSSYVLFESQLNGTGGIVLQSVAGLGLHQDDIHGGGFPRIGNLQIGDLNGDGLGDLLYYNDDARSWRFRLNRGGSGAQFDLEREIPTDDSTGWPHRESRRDALQLADVNGDGHPDALFPNLSGTSAANWNVSTWSRSMNAGVGGFESPVWTAARARRASKNQSYFVDLNGDGKIDQALLGPFDNSSIKVALGYGVNSANGNHSGYDPLSRLKRVTDGFGAWTELNYQSLVQPSVYRRGSGAPYSGFGNGAVVYDVRPALYVVSSAVSLSPQDGASCAGASQGTPNCTTQVQYFYADARIQGGGRGFLGFGEVSSYDPQSGMLTKTRYRQDFPFIGMPRETRSWHLSSSPWSSSGAPTFPSWVNASCSTWASSWSVSGRTFLGCKENTWSEVNTVAGLTHPYLARAEEWSFNPKYSSGVMNGSDFTHRVVTENSGVDAFGNIGQVEVRTHTSLSGAGSLLAKQTTVNAYSDTVSSTKWHLGRLTCSIVTSERNGQAPITRTSTFDYDDAKGILIRETVNAADCSDATGELRTDYVLDDYGNRIETALSGRGITSARRTKSIYDVRGRYVDVEQVWLNGSWVTTSQVRNRDEYGNPVHVEDGRGVEAWSYFDPMGKPHYSYTPDGSWTRTLHRTGGHSWCPSGTASREETSAADGSKSWRCKDRLGRETRRIVWGFGSFDEDGNQLEQRIYSGTRYDYASRPFMVSEPYEPGQPVYWSETSFDEIGRTEHIVLPDGNTESWSYIKVGTGTNQGIQVQHVNARNKIHRTENNALGEKRREIAPDGGITKYEYDALGRLISTDGPLPNSGNTFDKIEIQYDTLGFKTQTIDPDKGTWQYRHNALGELTCQIDAKNQGIEIQRDALGRESARYERTGVSDLVTCGGSQQGITTWTYDDTPGDGSFGEVVQEVTQYSDGVGANHATTRVYSFDTLGRLEQTDTTIAEAGSGFYRTYTDRNTYDRFGRVFQSFDAAGGDRGVQYVYNAFGYLSRLEEARRGSDVKLTYWAIKARNAHGDVVEATRGNHGRVTANYDPETGRLLHKVDTAGFGVAQDLELWWDEVGNLTRKHDLGGMRDQLEVYDYDDRDRLFDVKRSTDGGPMNVVQRLRFDKSGNILCKSDVSQISCFFSGDTNYAYGAGSAGPHAVTAAGNRTFQYDANGNVEQDRVNGIADRDFHYTVYDKLRRVERGTKQVEFHYGADRSRTLKRELEGGIVTRRTHYVGDVEVIWEGSSPAPGTGEYRRRIGGVAQATYFEATGVERVRYLHTDHLGSITAITDENGLTEAQMGFDAWGQRRDGEDWSEVWEQWAMGGAPVWAMNAIAITPRGFTGHEHVDDMGIIHMNGRIYDALLGRFLQADPFIEDATTLNRYTYVHNNPLASIDPSGYFSLSFKDVLKIAAIVAISTFLPQTLMTQFAFKELMAKVVTGAIIGGITTGSVEGALVGAFSAGVFHGIGAGFESLPEDHFLRGKFLGTDLNPLGHALKSTAHGLTGGVVSKVQGGKFMRGFSSAGVTQFFSGGIDHIDGDADWSPYRVAAASVLGGAVSEISGGKFANGAVTAAFSRAFNDEPLRERVHPHTRCKMNSCHGVPYDKVYATDEELFWLNAATIAVDMALPFPPMIAGGKLIARFGAPAGEGGVRLQKQLASQEQLGELARGGGTVINQPAKQADRIAAQTGRNADDIQKVSSDARVMKDGVQIETHAFRDASTNELFETRTIISRKKNIDK